MNSAIIGSATGIGFAVPSNLIKALLPQLEHGGHVVRGWLGVAIQDVSPALAKGLRLGVNEGALVSAVNPGSPARAAGLRTEDAVVALDGQPVHSANGLTTIMRKYKPGSTISLGYATANQGSRTSSLTLIAGPVK